jgi:hypothetical protein
MNRPTSITSLVCLFYLAGCGSNEELQHLTTAHTASSYAFTDETDCTPGFSPTFQDVNDHSDWAEYRAFDATGDDSWYDSAAGDVQVQMEIPSYSCEVTLPEGSWHKNKGSARSCAVPVPDGTPIKLRLETPDGDIAYSVEHGWNQDVNGAHFVAQACTTTACTADADCDDGDYCNGAEVCDAGACQPGPVPCPDDVECLDTTCDEAGDTCVTLPDPVDTPCTGGTCDGAGNCDGAPPGASDCTPGFSPTFQDVNDHSDWAEYRAFDASGNHDWYDSAAGDVQMQMEIPSLSCEVELPEGSWHKNKGSARSCAVPVPDGTGIVLRLETPDGDVAYSVEHGWNQDINGTHFAAQPCP